MSSLSPPRLVDNLFKSLPPQLHPFLQLSYPVNRTFAPHTRFTPLLSYNFMPNHQTLYDKASNGPMHTYNVCVSVYDSAEFIDGIRLFTLRTVLAHAAHEAERHSQPDFQWRGLAQ